MDIQASKQKDVTENSSAVLAKPIFSSVPASVDKPNFIQVQRVFTNNVKGVKIPVQLKVLKAIPVTRSNAETSFQPSIFRIVKTESVATNSVLTETNVRAVEGNSAGLNTADPPLPSPHVKIESTSSFQNFSFIESESNYQTRMSSTFQNQPNQTSPALSDYCPKSIACHTPSTSHMTALIHTISTPLPRTSPEQLPAPPLSTSCQRKHRRTLNGDKNRKGLRHFAMRVCEKVKEKMTTTYNEVADELVDEYVKEHAIISDQQYDQKNIRRRVYDALNVLMAVGILQKDRKEIRWLGFPTNSIHELESLKERKQMIKQRIEQKTAQLRELILQQILFKNLVQRNKRIEETLGNPSNLSIIPLPFIIVSTSNQTVIDCSISNDKHEYLFNFDKTFEIHDDVEVLKQMGMAYGLENGRCSSDDLKTAQSMLPTDLQPYLKHFDAPHAQRPSNNSTSFREPVSPDSYDVTSMFRSDPISS